jgi:hypothetical protein
MDKNKSIHHDPEILFYHHVNYLEGRLKFLLRKQLKVPQFRFQFPNQKILVSHRSCCLSLLDFQHHHPQHTCMKDQQFLLRHHWLLRFLQHQIQNKSLLILQRFLQ